MPYRQTHRLGPGVQRRPLPLQEALGGHAGDQVGQGRAVDAGGADQIGPYSFRPAGKVLVDPKGKKIRLTEKETNILKYLYRAGAKPVSREELLTEVWGYNAGVTTHTLETHIYRLRQKIEPEPGQARLLLTDAGGYRLQP